MSHQIDFKSIEKLEAMSATKCILAFFHSSITFSNKLSFLEMQFQLENLTHSAKDQTIIQLNICAAMKHIHMKLVLKLQMNPAMDSQAWTHNPCADTRGQQI